jgi:hypothetical protein
MLLLFTHTGIVAAKFQDDPEVEQNDDEEDEENANEQPKQRVGLTTIFKYEIVWQDNGERFVVLMRGGQ